MSHEKTLLIRPEFLNYGGTLFGGYMMQWADDLACVAVELENLPKGISEMAGTPRCGVRSAQRADPTSNWKSLLATALVRRSSHA